MEQCVLEFGSMIAEDVYIIMRGYFTTRTGSKNSVFDTEERPRNITNEYSFNRSSQARVENTSGNHLIDLCNVPDCSTLNGADSFQFDDVMTFISTQVAKV